MYDTIELFKDSESKYRWHVRAGNNRILDQGQAHTFKRNAKRAARRSHPGLPVVDLTRR